MKNKNITKAGGNWWKLIKEVFEETNNPSFVIPPYKRKFERNQLLRSGDYSKTPSTKRRIDFAQSLPAKYGNIDFNRGMSIMTILEPKERIHANLNNLEQYFVNENVYGNSIKQKGKKPKRSDVIDSSNPGRYAFISPEKINTVRETLNNYNSRPDYQQTIDWQRQGEKLQNKIDRARNDAIDYDNKKSKLQDLGIITGTIGAVSTLSQSGYPNSEFSTDNKKNSSGSVRVNKNMKKKYFLHKYFKG